MTCCTGTLSLAQSLCSSGSCDKITTFPFSSAPDFPAFGDHRSSSLALKHSGLPKEASPKGLGLVSWFVPISPYIVVLAVAPDTCTPSTKQPKAPCHQGLCSPHGSPIGLLHLISHFGCARKQCWSWAAGGRQNCPAVAEQCPGIVWIRGGHPPGQLSEDTQPGLSVHQLQTPLLPRSLQGGFH